MAPGEKSLAVEVEDHPLAYGEFEGVIPSGNYGAGTVMLWDRGSYSVEGGDPARAHRAGKISFALSGQKLLGQWTLVRLRSRPHEAKTAWLILRHHDGLPRTKTKLDFEHSVLTGRTLAEIAAGKSPRPRTAPTPIPGPKRKTSATSPASAIGFIEPMKARAVAKIPAGEWKLEIKFDGYRALALLRDDVVTLWSRNRRDLSGDYPEIVAALTELRCREAMIDGELVALDAEGRTRFQLLQQRARRDVRPALRFYAFDVLSLEGRSLLTSPLEQRQKQLARLIGQGSDLVQVSPVFDVPPNDLLKAAREQRLEGIVAKRSGSRYEPGRRSGAWLKCRLSREQEFVVGGLTPPQGSRSHFGALLIGYRHGRHSLYAGKVGTGFDERALGDLDLQLRRLTTPTCPFANLPLPTRSRFGAGMTAAAMRTVTWVKPRLVCQVRFTEWTDDGLLRHPVFLGIRHDKRATDVRRERFARDSTAGVAAAS